jgi:NTE family protein
LIPDGAGGRTDLVLEGGGVKGIGLVGAVEALMEGGYTFYRVAGTSAGAIVAALLAALTQNPDHKVTELTEIMNNVQYKNFEKAPPHGHPRTHGTDRGPAFWRMWRQHGLHTAWYLTDWLGEELEKLGVRTFADLKLDDPGLADRVNDPDKMYRLVVHTADITRGKLVRLPWDYRAYGIDPDEVRVVDAVRASMAIPFFFTPSRIPGQDCTHLGCHYPSGTYTWVDGGLLSNFPVEVFDPNTGLQSRWPTIGIKLSARATDFQYPKGHLLLDEGKRMVHTVLDNADRYYDDPSKSLRTIFVDHGSVGTTDFGLDQKDRDFLFSSGRSAASKCMAEWQADAAQAKLVSQRPMPSADGSNAEPMA